VKYALGYDECKSCNHHIVVTGTKPGAMDKSNKQLEKDDLIFGCLKCGLRLEGGETLSDIVKEFGIGGLSAGIISKN